MAPSAPLFKPVINEPETMDPFLNEFGWPEKTGMSSPDNRGSLANNPASNWFPEIPTQGVDFMDVEMLIQSFPQLDFTSLDVSIITEEIIISGPTLEQQTASHQSAIDFIDGDNGFPSFQSMESDYDFPMESAMYFPLATEDLTINSFNDPAKSLYLQQRDEAVDSFLNSLGVKFSSSPSSSSTENVQYEHEQLSSFVEVQHVSPSCSPPQLVESSPVRVTKSTPKKSPAKSARKPSVRRQASRKNSRGTSQKKKDQNVQAARRYREKKRQAQNVQDNLHETLLKEREDLLKNQQELLNEIKNYLHLAEKKSAKMKLRR